MPTQRFSGNKRSRNRIREQERERGGRVRRWERYEFPFKHVNRITNLHNIDWIINDLLLTAKLYTCASRIIIITIIIQSLYIIIIYAEVCGVWINCWWSLLDSTNGILAFDQPDIPKYDAANDKRSSLQYFVNLKYNALSYLPLSLISILKAAGALVSPGLVPAKLGNNVQQRCLGALRRPK